MISHSDDVLLFDKLLESDYYHSIVGFFCSVRILSISGEVVVYLVVLLILLLISGFVSGSEVAFFSLKPNELENLRETKSRLNKMVLHQLSFPDRLLATILITNNFVNIGIVILSTFLTNLVFEISGPYWVTFLLQVVAVTALILFCSEIFPKVYANRFAIQFARLTAPGLAFFNKLFWPISTFLIYSTLIVNRKLMKHSGNLSIDDLSDALELTESHLNEERDILKGIVKFGNIDVCDIMRSRVDTVAVEINTPYKDLLKRINDSGYSRIPVYEDNFDQIRGILYIKDLMPHLSESNSFEWQSMIRPSYFVPESKKINDLLKEFQTNRIHMAVVVDEYGGTSGIVTLEDILEEIVGEITDESDAEVLPYEKIDDNNFIFEGKILLNDLYKVLELEDDIFNKVKGEADTLAGLILELRGEFPRKDDKLTYKNLTFTITSVDHRRIKKIKVSIRPTRK
ncbi:MAG: gliding motility-associated protein GldE [Bacteroidales bacterium]|nr:gliding motility-associated protein GldE [Bacteroidales bacterium]